MTQPLPPGAFAKALQDKRAAARRRRLLIWGGAGTVLAAALIVGYLAFLSPVFAARQVVVTGTDLLDADEVREILRATDLNTLTPIEAMNLLFELQKKARG